MKIIHYGLATLRVLMLSVCFILLNACSQKAVEPLPVSTMSKILAEMHIAEVYAQYVPRDTSNHQLKNQDSLLTNIAHILAENKTTELRFKESMEWYNRRPELMDSIYQQILTDLAIWQSRINKN